MRYPDIGSIPSPLQRSSTGRAICDSLRVRRVKGPGDGDGLSARRIRSPGPQLLPCLGTPEFGVFLVPALSPNRTIPTTLAMLWIASCVAPSQRKRGRGDHLLPEPHHLICAFA